ncbi:uncharacterized protein KNAG_0E03140 [Huiozyma naganishii CBS 8797]|uniref:Uncharacterized protein n=1 Tax=Huiozyma naganishii (strain ATCC MYA-139 / BCRC 22969 / CBS 8797 / KCTC 17520 / NBRC 10181 / NCYC 3082 / Yp74L-3) TaxID=1071383 RepID=J7RM05_HUIN7|nr:hypothetical protein KNAG_0E03140 [Kazachstania naganishii CBS 8797]CCK70573.1 hypothetical protein KNAG_0E03140 [Kazachstania naganishii CBS 8797]
MDFNSSSRHYISSRHRVFTETSRATPLSLLLLHYDESRTGTTGALYPILLSLRYSLPGFVTRFQSKSGNSQSGQLGKCLGREVTRTQTPRPLRSMLPYSCFRSRFLSLGAALAAAAGRGGPVSPGSDWFVGSDDVFGCEALIWAKVRAWCHVIRKRVARDRFFPVFLSSSRKKSLT